MREEAIGHLHCSRRGQRKCLGGWHKMDIFRFSKAALVASQKGIKCCC
jgi:hypothetical protein